MNILSHRGYWKDASEKNSLIAFERSFSMGFGVETDIRDVFGELVISHDMPTLNYLTFEKFLDLYVSYDKTLWLALNVKSDGLQRVIQDKLKKHGIENYFLFDMSIPDSIVSISESLNVFMRQSDIEKDVLLYEDALGVWLDEFNRHWIDEDVIVSHYNNNKKICIVSPELHKREYKNVWAEYKKIQKNIRSEIFLCTDFPEDARGYFNE